ncbi:hypothetical protein AC1031_007884 [Aphanomyces cochlioides]|nr:hypothetical protein AC1031_007884 [Aphanomyces cochlioides]
MSPGQCQMIQESCFGPDIPLPYELLQQAFEERAATKPHLIAVDFEGQRITYGELNEQATTLAHHLVSLGVGVGSRVAVVMERCLEFPIGLLAVLKSGGSMMPLDATFPSNRLTFMLGDAKACVVVSTKDYRDQVEALELSIPVLYIDSTNLATTPNASGVLCPATRKDEAYVVYTSGSTGRPKGVPVLHVGAVNLTLFPLKKGAFIEGTRVMQFLAIGFDWCLEEIWKTLNNGATLVLRSKSFLEDPFVCGGGRMFRTGDYGRLLPNGRFEIHGRKDSQVKLKGYRIELEQIGEAMMHHPQVTAAVAVVKDKTHVVGYFTPASVNVEELRTLVTSYLPVYMIPAVWVPLESMPQNVNGKTDRLALERMDVVVQADALVTDVEVKMAEVWSSVLSIDSHLIGRNASLYALGGDSLSVVKVVAACRKIGLAISVAQLLKNPVLSRAAGVCGTEAAIDWPPVVLPEAIVNEVADTWATPLDLHEYVGIQSRHYKLICCMQLSKNDLRTCYRRITRQHEIFRTTFASLTSGFFQIIRNSAEEPSVDHVNVPNLEQFLEADYIRGFGLSAWSFVRFTIVTDCAGEYAVLTIHHSLYDGWSFPLLVEDLLATFHGRYVSPRPSFRKFVDYIQAQDTTKTEAYWTTSLRGVVPSIIGSSGPKLPDIYASGPPLEFDLPVKDISHAAKRAGVTLATLTRFAWASTMRKFLRQNDVVLIETISNRNIPVKGIERMLGATLSAIPTRITIDDARRNFYSPKSSRKSYCFIGTFPR